MAILPIDPSIALSATDKSMGSMPSVTAPAQGTGQGFGGMLSNAISSLDKTQTDAAQASQSLVNGTATDPTQVVTQVERARLSMQLASQIRTKAVESYNDIFHTQV
jgi:flagellar hook-basal body complex protein FliE